MTLQKSRNEKELKKAEEAGSLDKSKDFSGKSPADNDKERGFENSDRIENQFVRSSGNNKTTGRETGQVFSPEVALSPTSTDSAEKNDNNWKTQKRLVVNNAFIPREDKTLDNHPFLDLDRDQGIFIPNRQGMTTDDMLEQINKEVFRVKQHFNIQERDQNGDTVLDTVIVQERKRNDDGTIQLTNGKPITGALQQNWPRRNLVRNFIAYPVVKDSEIGEGTKAPEDGVIVIRIA